MKTTKQIMEGCIDELYFHNCPPDQILTEALTFTILSAFGYQLALDEGGKVEQEFEMEVYGRNIKLTIEEIDEKLRNE